jgi:hypothetical protein
LIIYDINTLETVTEAFIVFLDSSELLLHGHNICIFGRNCLAVTFVAVNLELMKTCTEHVVFPLEPVNALITLTDR